MSMHKQVYAPTHPKASASGCVYRHMLVAEQALGHYLPAKSHVHHVDGDPHNNDTRNLVICEDAAYHRLLHVRTRILKAGGDPNVQKICSRCKKLIALQDFGPMTANVGYGRQSACRSCMNMMSAARRARK